MPQAKETTGISAADESSGWNSFSKRHPWATWFLLFVALSICITVWRWEIIDSPPYWDTAMGLFLEANFLADTEFDYARLWFEERRFIEGGAAIYLTSVLPTFVALLMTWFHSPDTVFVAYHLFTFACAAAATLLVVAICRPWSGTLGAVLIGAVVLTTPIFSVQIDMLGMDLPMLVLALLSAWCVVREHYVWAALTGCAAAVTKMSGGLVLGALFVPLLLDLALRYRGKPVAWRRRIWLFTSLACFALAGVLILDASIENLDTSAVEHYEINQTQGLIVMKDLPYWCPELVLIAITTMVAWPVVTAWRVIASRREGRSTQDAIHAVLAEDPIEIYSWAIILGILLILSLAYTIPRYLILPLPFLYMIVGSLLFRGRQKHWLAATPLAVLLGFNLANQDGRFYPTLPEEARIDYRTGAILERSREYLADHRANQRAVAYLAEHCADRTIFVGNPFVHFLALPRLGYVNQSLHGYSVSTYGTEHFPTVEQLSKGEAPDPVFVHVLNRFDQNSLGRVPAPTDADIVLWQDGHRESPITIYEKRENPLSTPEENKNRLISIVWPIDRQFARAKYLAAHGQPEKAFRVYETLLGLDPNHHDARFTLAGLQASQGMLEEAVENYQRVLQARNDVAEVHKAYADVLIDLDEMKEAEHQLWLAIDIDAEYPEALRALGIVLLQRKENREAVEAFLRATRAEPEDARTWLMLGMARGRTGDRAGAIESLERSLEIDPTAVKTHQELATVYAMAGRPADAIEHFQRALILRPEDDETANNLAWILATWPESTFRDGPAAVALVEPRIQGTEVTPGMLDTMAAAYAEAGQFGQAITTAQRALKLAQQQHNAPLVEKIAMRLKLYEQRRPFHAPARS